MRSPLALISLLALASLSGCNCGGTPSGTDEDGGLTHDGGPGADGGRTSGDGGQRGPDGGLLDGGSGFSAEICDGLDNDGDGIIDNVDVGMDGVCDCLKIATLGYKGKWGTGSVFANWLDGKSLAGAVNLEAQTITPGLIAPFHIIVVQDVRTSATAGVGSGLGRSYAPAEIQALKDWVAAGGGLMTLIGYGTSTEVVNVNTVLAPYGLSYGSSAILPGSGGSTAPVTHWASHPLADAVTRIGVDNGYAVHGDAGTVIAWEPTPGHDDVGRAVERELGHVFVWGDEWITYDSEWTSHPDYQVPRFWLNSLKWLTPANFCQVQIPVIN